MVLVPSKLFILSVLISGFLVNGMIVPSFAVPPIPTICDSCHPIAASEWSPLKQFKNYIPLPNIFCKSGLVLVFKISDGSPACMKSETAQKLVERGWGVLNEQTVWFEYNPIACQLTPWGNFLPKWYANMTMIINLPEIDKIKLYFNEQQGITIIEAESTPNYNLGLHPAPNCGQTGDFSYYFLVPESNADKMTSLGYKKVDNVPSYVHAVRKL